jgi:hypothetical protein
MALLVDKSVTISLRCSTGWVHCENWKIDLPPFYFLEEGGDLNQSLANTKIIAGDTFSFGFVVLQQGRRTSNLLNRVFMSSWRDNMVLLSMKSYHFRQIAACSEVKLEDLQASQSR